MTDHIAFFLILGGALIVMAAVLWRHRIEQPAADPTASEQWLDKITDLNPERKTGKSDAAD